MLDQCNKIDSLNLSFLCFRCDSIDKLRNKMIALEGDVNDASKFKDLYQFTFNFAKAPSQKSLDLEDAIAYWKMLLADRFKYLDIWIKFLLVSLLTGRPLEPTDHSKLWHHHV